MAEAYSGLRRRRKRTHPTKCPCCISDSELEPENQVSAGSAVQAEEAKDAKPRKIKRRKTVKEKGSNNNEDEDTFENEERLSIKDKNSRTSYQSLEQQKKKKVAKKVPKKKGSAEKNTTKEVNNTEKQTATHCRNATKSAPKRNSKLRNKSKVKSFDENTFGSLVKVDEEFQSDDELSLSSLKAAGKKKASNSKTLLEGKVKGREKEGDEKKSIPGKKKNQEPKAKKKESQNIKSKELNSKEELENHGWSSDDGKDSKGIGKGKKLGGLNKKPKLVKDKKSDESNTRKLKEKTAFSNVQIKTKVFDHLFKNLKYCLGENKLPLREAADILFKVSSEDLHSIIQPGVGRRKPRSEQSNIHVMAMERKSDSNYMNITAGSISQPVASTSSVVSRKNQGLACPATEETVSQAAEALVSFRSKSPVLREEKQDEVLQLTAFMPQNNIPKQEASLSNMTNVRMASPSIAQLITSTFSPTQAVQALMQIQTSNRLTTQGLPSQVTDALVQQARAQQLFPGQAFLAGNMSHTFANMAQSSAGASLANPLLTYTSQGSLPNFSQLTTQLRQNLGTSGDTSLLNPGVVTPTMQTPPVLLPSQGHLQQKSQVVNTVSSNQLQVMAGIKTASPCLETSRMQGKPQQQLLSQQPLKGMEEVVGNVGSNVPSLVWGSPVVFLGSPQNLGGVPRNLMAAQGSQPVNVVSTQEQSVYHPVAPKPAQKEALNISARVNQGPASPMPSSNVLSIAGRPILPRTQPRPTIPEVSTCVVQSSVVHHTSTGVVPSPGAAVPTNIWPVSTQSTTLFTHGQHASLVTSAPTQRGRPLKTQTISIPGKVPNVQATPGSGKMTGASHRVDISSAVTAKQAVKKLVHERTKSAELKKEGKISGNMQSPGKLKPILPSTRKASETTTSHTSEFNLEQAATTLLSIGAQESTEGGSQKSQSMEEISLDEPEDKVVFTSKGVFRVGDVDVDPEYNRIGIEGYTCGKCGKIFTSLNYLARHIKRVCPDMSCRKWKCSMCEKAFRHPFGLQQHIYTHTGERPHKCPLCPKAFYSSNDLRRHSRIHSGERPYRCKHCDKCFATTISLKTHTYIHTGEKPHKCPQCPKTFATSSKLGRHIVTHSEQRPYSCDQCPKSFNRSGDLRRHSMTVHEGKEKTYDCEECSMTFTRSADQRRHSLSVHKHQDKQLECGECLASFSTAICLKMHKETHHKGPTATALDSEKPFKCETCGKTYDSALQLDKHQPAHEPTSTAGYNSTQFQLIAPRPTEEGLNQGPG